MMITINMKIMGLSVITLGKAETMIIKGTGIMVKVVGMVEMGNTI